MPNRNPVTTAGKEKFSSGLLGFLARCANLTDKDRLTEEHTDVFNGNFTWHRNLQNEMKIQRNS